MRHTDGWTEVISAEGGRGMVPTTFVEIAGADPEALAARRAVAIKVFTMLDAVGKAERFDELAAVTRAYSAGRVEAGFLRDSLVRIAGHDVGRKSCVDVASLLGTERREALLAVAKVAQPRTEVGWTATDPDARPIEWTPANEQQDTRSALFEDDDVFSSSNTDNNDWIKELSRRRAAERQKPKPESQRREVAPAEEPDPFATASAPPSNSSNPFSSDVAAGATASEMASPAHCDEREILLSRSHGVGAYNPQVVERLQRLREDEELAARLQREEDEHARRAAAARAGIHIPPHPEDVQDTSADRFGAAPTPARDEQDSDFWGSLFGSNTEISNAPQSDVTATAQPDYPTSGAGVWNSIFGASPTAAPPASSPYGQQREPSMVDRARQELEDERLARQLQAEEEQAFGGQSPRSTIQAPRPDATSRTPSASSRTDSGSRRSRPSPSNSFSTPAYASTIQTQPQPSAQPTSADLGLFRCGACSETMHVRNAVPGAQFACPLCGRMNTI